MNQSAKRNPLLESAAPSMDQLPMLPVIFDAMGTGMGDRMKHLSPSAPYFTLTELSGGRIGDVLDEYEMQAIAGVIHVPAWDTRLVVGFDRDFLYTTVELFFGGDGSEPPIEDVRSFSSIEKRVAGYLFEQAAVALQKAFEPVSEARFRFERAETRIDFASAGRRSKPAVVARFLMQAINRGGGMFVVVPQSALAPMRQQLSQAPSTGEASETDPVWVQQIASELQRAEVPIRAMLESDSYTLADIADLKVGDTLKLEATLNSRVKVVSDEEPLYWAFVGENDGLHTLRIDDPVDPNQQFFNDVLSR